VTVAVNDMRRSRVRFSGAYMKKLLLTLVTGLAMAGMANASYAQHRGGGFHSASGFHGNGFHNGGFHHFHHGRFNHSFFFIGAPFFWAPGNYPYLYPYPYPVTSSDYLEPALLYAPAQQDYRYYCPDQGYYPAIQTCPKGWLRVIPEDSPGL
jgi:hypothetical protein